MESSTYHQPSRVRAKTGSPKVPLVWPSVSRQRQLQSVPLAIVRPWPLAAEAISRPRLETESLEPQSPPRSARPVPRSGGDKCSRDGSLESPGNLGLTFHMNPGLTSQLLNIPAGRRTLPLFIIFFFASHGTVLQPPGVLRHPPTNKKPPAHPQLATLPAVPHPTSTGH